MPPTWKLLVGILCDQVPNGLVNVFVEENSTEERILSSIVEQFQPMLYAAASPGRLAFRMLNRPLHYSQFESLQARCDFGSLRLTEVSKSLSSHLPDGPPPIDVVRFVVIDKDLPWSISPRKETVQALCEILLKPPHVLRIHSCSGSGKMTLLQLLADHLRSTSSQPVSTLFVWSLKQLESTTSNPLPKYLFILEQNQLARCELSSLWRSDVLGIVFLGSLELPKVQEPRISLHPKSSIDGTPLPGLLFSRTEFNELMALNARQGGFKFSPTFLEKLFEITIGHVGAIQDFCERVQASQSYKDSMSSYSWDDFL